MTLHVDGRYTYRETRGTAVVKLVNSSPIWSVEGRRLVLGSRDAKTHSFVRQESRGVKDVEQRILKIEIPVDIVLKRCTFTGFSQQLDPFPGHTPLDSSKCICGLIDPASPALHDPRVVLDRIPLRA